MSKNVFVKCHEVEISTIVGIQPLIRGGAMLSPEAGVVLILDEGAKREWIGEKEKAMPAVGDFIVRDQIIGLDYFVVAAQFDKHFAESIRNENTEKEYVEAKSS